MNTLRAGRIVEQGSPLSVTMWSGSANEGAAWRGLQLSSGRQSTEASWKGEDGFKEGGGRGSSSDWEKEKEMKENEIKGKWRSSQHLAAEWFFNVHTRHRKEVGDAIRGEVSECSESHDCCCL